MNTPGDHPTRRSQSANTKRYDRIARTYSVLEPLYLIFPPARRRAVAALGLKAGDTVLEMGAGTGRNFPYLVEAVGPSGTVIGVDASPGMLAEARKLIERNVVMDAGLTQGGPWRLLAPIARLLVKYAPGDAYSDPWRDLANYGPVETKRFLLGFFYISSVVKTERF
jgi:SAM-dependent methyltransferase